MSIWSKGERSQLDKPQGITDCYIYFEPKDIVKIPKASTFGISFYAMGLDYWIDCGGKADTWDEMLKVPETKKIFRKMFYRSPIARAENTYFVDLWQLSKGIDGCFHLNKDNPHFLWVGTTIGVLMNLIVFMGYTKIHIVNGDFTGYKNYPQRLFLCEFAEVAKNYGVTLISCVDHQQLCGAMQYIPLKEAICLTNNEC